MSIEKDRWSRGRVLVVEDDDLMGKLLVRVLQKNDHDPLWIDNGNQLSEAMERHQPDIILMDLNLPGRSGFELIEQVKSSDRYRHVPIIVTSGQTGRECLLKALNLGAEDYVPKPFDMAELNARINNLMRNKKLTDFFKRSHNYWRDHDEVTGLANKHAIDTSLQQYLERGMQIAVIVIDVDDFHRVYNGMGNQAGDALLVRVSDCLLNSLPSALQIARIDASRFAVLVETDSRERVDLLTQVVRRAIAAPMNLNGRDLLLTASMGVCMAPAQAEDHASALRCASVAVQESRQRGGDHVEIYDARFDESRSLELDLENDLLSVLERQELSLAYQPQIDLQTGELMGVEALIRWIHPTHGFVSPAKLIEMAERNLSIIPIGRWVIRESCRFWRACSQAGRPELSVAINLSPKQFRDVQLVHDVMQIVTQEKVPPSAIEFEITESCSMEDVDLTQQILSKLKHLGFRVAVDDFGTGYSSLSYLTGFPLDTLKVDRAFVQDLPHNAAAAAVATGIVSIAKSLDMTCLAEGIETEEQLDFLRQLGCAYGQGYLFSKPVPFEEMMKQVRNSNVMERESA